MKITVIFLSLLLAVVLIGCGGKSDFQEEFGDTIAIPTGYEFVTVSAYGEQENNVTIYILDQVSERIFQYQDGEIGPEVLIPYGHTFVGASARGTLTNHVTLYCAENETNKIVEC